MKSSYYIKALRLSEVGSCFGAYSQLVCAEAKISEVDRNLLWGRQFLNPYAFTALEGDAGALTVLADRLRDEGG